ncbi:MAG: UDP-3-O-acyl-N-acetylglucosamine deacetylase [Pseudomonadota bacterium]
MRNTIAKVVSCRGVGLHSGRPVTMHVMPAASGQGIVFRRTDVAPGEGEIPARYDMVADAHLCTRLANRHGHSVGTVEHLMAALSGLGINDATVALDGAEVPIMDGSSAGFVEAFSRVGVTAQRGDARALRILKPVELRDGDRLAALTPAHRFSIAFDIDFAERAIGRQSIELEMTGQAFQSELADCRTFGCLSEVEQLRKLGLGLGGNLDNAIVVEGDRVLNPEGLRRTDEFVRHKALDAVGDLALAGAPIIGRYVGVKAGHDMTNRLLRKLFDTPDAWALTPLPEWSMRLAPRPLQMHPARTREAVAV